MSFNENFPSLHGMELEHKTIIGNIIEVYEDDVINTFCLDKQKVREAWLKYKENWDNGNPLSPNELKELLGLKG